MRFLRALLLFVAVISTPYLLIAVLVGISVATGLSATVVLAAAIILMLPAVWWIVWDSV
jgi:hypothetical protein